MTAHDFTFFLKAKKCVVSPVNIFTFWLFFKS